MRPEHRLHIIRIFFALILVFICYGYYVINTVPSGFPTGSNFVVEEDESLRSISFRLEDGGYIRSALMFRALVSFFGGDRHVQLGGYTFATPLSLLGVVDKLVSESPDTPLVKVTIPEGSTVEEIANFLHLAIPGISQTLFIQKVSSSGVAGRLFPSTYFLLPSTTEDRSIEIMVSTFEKKYKEQFQTAVIPKQLSGIDDVISLAAILEGEAKDEVDKKIVAGILLKRLSLGMPLQVDVDKRTYDVKGVPKVPVDNPGLVAINAVFNPTVTDYLYYITGKDGKMYYAKTFSEHKRNIQNHL